MVSFWTVVSVRRLTLPLLEISAHSEREHMKPASSRANSSARRCTGSRRTRNVGVPFASRRSALAGNRPQATPTTPSCHIPAFVPTRRATRIASPDSHLPHPGDRAPRALQARGVDVLRVPTTEGRLDLGTVLKTLATRGITRLMIEAGPIVSAAFVNADLVDAAVVFQSSAAIGPSGIDSLEGLPLAAVTASPRLANVGTETAGSDTMTCFARPPG